MTMMLSRTSKDRNVNCEQAISEASLRGSLDENEDDPHLKENNYKDWSHPIALIEQGGRPLEYVDQYGKNALHYALRGSAPSYIIEMLLAHGLDASHADVDGWTPLHLYMRLWKRMDEAVLHLLLSHGADPNKLNNAGESSLFLGALNNVSASTMQALLRAGGDVNARNSEGETPLVIAAKYGDLSRETVAELLAHGADPWLRDSSGRNALDWGREKGHEALVKQMRKVRYGV